MTHHAKPRIASRQRRGFGMNHRQFPHHEGRQNEFGLGGVEPGFRNPFSGRKPGELTARAMDQHSADRVTGRPISVQIRHKRRRYVLQQRAIALRDICCSIRERDLEEEHREIGRRERRTGKALKQ